MSGHEDEGTEVRISHHGIDALVVRQVEEGWEITGDSLRGHVGATATIIDLDGAVAMSEIIRHFGMAESRHYLIRALREKTESAKKAFGT